MAKQFKRKPTNKPVIPPKEIEAANDRLKKRGRHIEAADVGNPGKFIKIDLKKVYRWCVYGMNDREIAESLDVKYETFMAWCRPTSKGSSNQKSQMYKPELAAAIAKGRVDVYAKVADRLVSRAMGYKHKATKFFYDSQEGKVVKQDYIQHYPPSEVAATFILKNRKPDHFKEKPVEEINSQLMSASTNVNIITDDNKIKELLKRKKDFSGSKADDAAKD